MKTLKQAIKELKAEIELEKDKSNHDNLWGMKRDLIILEVFTE